MKASQFLYRLFFTRDDDLDLLQVFFLLLIVFFMVSFALAAMESWKITTAAWATFGSVFTILGIAGTPKWVAGLIARSRAPGEVAQGIAQAGAEWTQQWAQGDPDEGDL
jgi:hypothetical protein